MRTPHPGYPLILALSPPIFPLLCHLFIFFFPPLARHIARFSVSERYYQTTPALLFSVC